MSDLHHIRLGTTYTAVFEFFKKVKNVPSYCEVSIHNDYPPMGQGIWKIDSVLEKKLAKVDYFNIQGEESLSETLWIIYHLAKRGSVLAFANLDHEKQGFIGQGYYKDKLQKLSFGNYKILPKADSNDKNTSNGVSFCIPTGGDSPQLRKCVERILSFKTPKEIILSGSVSDDFPYKDQVRIVGENIPYPPIRISEKKNVAIEAAKYSLACVLHDRVLLPKNFDELFVDLAPVPVMAIGGLFNLLKDNWSLVGRYSDFGISMKKEARIPSIQYLSKEGKPTYVFTKTNIFSYARNHNFFYGSDEAKRFGNYYATGSFFLVSKEVFNKQKLNEEFFWEEFEDVEWGERCYFDFIPHLFNTEFFHITQIVRPIILPPTHVLAISGETNCEIKVFDLPNFLGEVSYENNYYKNHEMDVFSEQRALLDRLYIFSKKYKVISHSQLLLAEKLLMKNDRQHFILEFKDILKKASPSKFNLNFIRDIEKVMGLSLEVVDVEDQRVNSEHFFDYFNFGERIINNISINKWFFYFEKSFIYSSFAKKNIETINKKREMYGNCLKNSDYLNGLFRTTHNPTQWFEIFQNLED